LKITHENYVRLIGSGWKANPANILKLEIDLTPVYLFFDKLLFPLSEFAFFSNKKNDFQS